MVRWMVVLAALPLACGGSSRNDFRNDDDAASNGGSAGSGMPSTGGSSAGGSTPSGGTTPNGGTAPNGGTPATGGSNGGSAGSGPSTGGEANSSSGGTGQAGGGASGMAGSGAVSGSATAGGGAGGSSGSGGRAGSGGSAGSGGCAEPSPAGCKQTGCPDGQECLASSSADCRPSQCTCTAGQWTCTRDCAGGVCRPTGAPPAACPRANAAPTASRGCAPLPMVSTCSSRRAARTSSLRFPAIAVREHSSQNASRGKELEVVRQH